MLSSMEPIEVVLCVLVDVVIEACGFAMEATFVYVWKGKNFKVEINYANHAKMNCLN